MLFVPIPDPRRPETLRQSNIRELQIRGCMAPQNDIAAWATREDYGKESVIRPEEGDTCKLWQYASPGETNQHVVYDRVSIHPTGSNEDPKFSHSTFEIYSYRVGLVYREHLAIFNVWTGIPVLRVATIDRTEARRLNTKPGISIDYPLGVHTIDNDGKTIAQWPMNHGLAFVPGELIGLKTDVLYLCAWNYEEFAKWVADGGFKAWQAAKAAREVAKPVTPPTAPTPAATTTQSGAWFGGEVWINRNSGMRINAQGQGVVPSGNDDGAEIETGFWFERHKGTFGSGGAWEGWYPTEATTKEMARLLEPHAAAKGVTVAGFGFQDTAPGIVPQRTIVIRRGAQKAEIPTANLASRLMGKMSIANGEVRRFFDADLGYALDDAIREMK